MRMLFQIKAIFVSLFLLVFILAPGCIIAAPFPLRQRLKIVGPVWGFFCRNLLRLACDSRIDICEDHRSPQFATTPPQGLYISNHQSFADIPLLFSIYQAPPIMKKEVLNIPIFGWMAWISGAIPVSRSSSASRRRVFVRAKKRIKEEQVGLLVYPEGTRSKDGLPRSFSEIKKTLLIWAFNERIPVIPTSLYGTLGVLKPNGLINPGRHVGIIVHKEILPTEFTSAEEFAEACWEIVVKGHDRMRTQLGPLNGN